MNETILKAVDVHYTYEDGSQALSGIDLEIKRGRKIAFMGANGSGKSTFFLCLNGIHKPQSGALYFNGSPYDYSRKGLLNLRSKIGIVFQDPDTQIFCASVYQEISFGILNLGASKEAAKTAVEEAISALEITAFSRKPTHALSGGQKKQVAIADILVMNPDIIILDEPTSALDPRHTILVNKIIDQLTEKGITVIISTHDVDYAYHWADEVVLFQEGKVLIHGLPEEVFVNKILLHKTNLEQPAALQLFERLCQKGILEMDLPLPRTLSQLESYIENIRGNFLMNQTSEKAILVVSFGTSYNETRGKTIDVIEDNIAKAYPDYTIYHAWTSKMILNKILKRDNLVIPNVKEAMEQLIADGMDEVIVQPTHVINGIENDIMKEDVLSFSEQISSIRFGTPLLTTMEDNTMVIEALMDEFASLEKDSVLVFMGHGTTHYANAIYAALDYTFKDYGWSNVFLGTVEAYPTVETILRKVRGYNPKKVILTPFMIVAGDHATNDMASDNPDSWRSQFEEAGFEVECVMKGLGEYSGIRDIFIRHIADII